MIETEDDKGFTKELLDRELNYYQPLREQISYMEEFQKTEFTKMMYSLSDTQLNTLLRFSEIRFYAGSSSIKRRLVEKFSMFLNTF